jgi:hypothetical protein
MEVGQRGALKKLEWCQKSSSLSGGKSASCFLINPQIHLQATVTSFDFFTKWTLNSFYFGQAAIYQYPALAHKKRMNLGNFRVV